METLQISKENALKAYDGAKDGGKKLLENLFGKQVFSKKITDRVKTFEDACEELGGPPELVSAVSRDIKSIEAYRKLIIIARALNEGWEPDWNNSNEYKYYPYFKMKAGFGLSGFDFTHSGTDASVGSRLCFKTAELAEYAGKQFENIYKDYLTL